MAWLSRTGQAFESFKRYARDIKVLSAHRALSSEAIGERLVYEVNPIYLEAGQGGTSPMRGWGAILFLFALIFVWWAAGWTFFSFIPNVLSRQSVGLPLVTLLAITMAFALVLGTFISFLYLAPAFFGATDVVTRYDRKRNKVWMWTGRVPIELDWNALTPAVRSGPASAYLSTRLYRGLYVEFGEDGEPEKTHGIAHVIQVGTISASEEGVLPAMEYVRSYMEQGPQSLPPVKRYLRARPQWWAMINFEPPRLYRRLPILRGWSHDEAEVFEGSPGASGTDGSRASM